MKTPNSRQDAASISQIVAEAMSKFQNADLADKLGRDIITPRFQVRKWDYSRKDGQSESLPCWMIAIFGRSGVGIAYSEFGHGVYNNPWGLISLSDEYFGANDGWYSTLEALVNDNREYIDD